MSESSVDRRRFLELCGASTLAALAGCSSSAPGGETTAGVAGNSDAPQETISQTESELNSPYAEVYRETIDSVVLVRADGSQGTGFVYDETHVVTNAHVVGRADDAAIRFSEGDWSTGSVVGTDPHSDLAVVEVDSVPEPATPLPFADSEPVVGQEVVAIGNPYNLNGSATTGVVSGLDRLIPSPTGYRIPDAIQTDAAVNPGNSGGPLMSLDGSVLAVINSGGGENIAFGISAALTQRVVPELVRSGDYDHAYVGASFTNVTPQIAAANDLDESRGLLVLNVASDGPATGVLRPSEAAYVDGRRLPVGGDVLLEIDGTTVPTPEDLWSYLALETRPGDTVELTVLRDGSRGTVDLELGTRPATQY
ncbi:MULTISPECIES: S1C family serine protease [Halobacterium]|uniref:S1C family serine protease n=1 Tax=Halobacterium TaxID=2239 RepID=UPI00073F149F|nr:MULTISPECIES: trypsin-like peptidase domain-containing protein [Halobacterium]MCG1003847.1 trypsin-like peptidase domain-containing protein [Halobacterium noricense]